MQLLSSKVLSRRAELCEQYEFRKCGAVSKYIYNYNLTSRDVKIIIYYYSSYLAFVHSDKRILNHSFIDSVKIGHRNQQSPVKPKQM